MFVWTVELQGVITPEVAAAVLHWFWISHLVLGV